MSQREDAKKQIKKLLEERYTSGKSRWFFQPLRVRTFLFPFSMHPSAPPYTTASPPALLYPLLLEC